MRASLWRTLLLLGALWPEAACGHFSTSVPEHVRLTQLEDVGAEQLGLTPGATSLVAAKQAMQTHRLTGLAQDTAVHGGVQFSVLGADFQRRLHFFRDDRYWTSVRLPQIAGPSYGLELRFANNGEQLMLLIVQQPPIASAESVDVLTVFEVTSQDVQARWQRPLSDLVDKNGGMSHPHMIGINLVDGVLLVARDAEGALWDESYVFKQPQQDEWTVTPRLMSDSMRCSCVRKYAVGR